MKQSFTASRFAPDLALVVTTVIWGSTFILAKDVLREWTPISYVTIRFAVAALALLILFAGELKKITKAEVRAGAILGLLVGSGFAVQAIGQVYTTATKSAFITAFTTPLVPLVALAIYRARPGLENLLGMIIATVGGFVFLAPRETAGVETNLNIGDLWTLCCTGLFATHIVLLGTYARRFDVGRLTLIQISAATLMFAVLFFGVRLGASVFGADALPLALAREAAPLVWSFNVAWQLVYLSLIGTVAAFLLWAWGQRRTTATHAAIIFTLEPVFATLFAVAIRGREEWLGGWAGFGALMILTGVLVSELRFRGRNAEPDIIAES